MVRYLDDEHLLVDTSNFVVDDDQLNVYSDLETEEQFFVLSIQGDQDLTKYLSEFGRLLRAKNFPQFVGLELAQSFTAINVILGCTSPFIASRAIRYLRTLFVANFPVTVTIVQAKTDHINGIMFVDELESRGSITLLSPLEKGELYTTIVQLRGANFPNCTIRFDLQPLWNYFSDDDWEQLCFGLFYFESPFLFVGPDANKIIMDNNERYKVDKNLAHYGVKPQYLSMNLSMINSATKQTSFIQLEEIFLWLHRFILETLFHNEQQSLEVEMDDPENLVTIVINNLREETALRRKRI